MYSTQTQEKRDFLSDLVNYLKCTDSPKQTDGLASGKTDTNDTF